MDRRRVEEEEKRLKKEMEMEINVKRIIAETLRVKKEEEE